MLNCKQTSSLSSQRLDRDLTQREKISLNMHLFVCNMCKQYAKQLEFLRQTSHWFDTHHQGTHRLSDEARARIRERLNKP